MQTRLSLAQLARPGVTQVDEILRKCVHCGFCNATCPTYELLGDELDGPRGRIYQIKSWLEEERAPSVTDVTHIDRCLSCLSCATTCPSGVDYMHLIDFARAEVEASDARTPRERWTRALLSRIVTSPRLFRWALRLGRLARPSARLLPPRLRVLLDLAGVGAVSEQGPKQGPEEGSEEGPRRVGEVSDTGRAGRRRVALLRGCVQDELRPQINSATVRMLGRLGCDVYEVSSASCCGALAHHLGRTKAAHRAARATAGALHTLIEREGVEHIVCTASGCGTMLKDYAQMLRGDPATESLGREIAIRTRDVSELIGELGGLDTLEADARAAGARRIAVHSPCSIHHGQRLGDRVTPLLVAAGFDATPLGDPHMCCGSAGVYNVLQPELADALRARKAELIRASGADVVATGNIGCLVQLRAGLRAAGLDIPVVHAVELMEEVNAARARQKSE